MNTIVHTWVYSDQVTRDDTHICVLNTCDFSIIHLYKSYEPYTEKSTLRPCHELEMVQFEYSPDLQYENKCNCWLLINSVHLHVQTYRWHYHRWALIGIPKRIWLITVIPWSFHHIKRPNRQIKQIMKIPQMDDSTAFFLWQKNKRDSLSAKRAKIVDPPLLYRDVIDWYY